MAPTPIALEGLGAEALAAARLLGIVKPDSLEPDPAFVKQPLQTLEGVTRRLDQLVELLDAITEPVTTILAGSSWYPLADTEAFIVATATTLGLGIHVASASGTIESLAHLPLVHFDRSGARVVAGSAPLRVTVTDPAFGTLDLSLALTGEALSGTLTLQGGQSFSSLREALDGIAAINTALEQQPHFLDEYPRGSASTVGQILVSAGVLRGSASPYEVNPSLSGPASAVALAVLRAAIQAVAGAKPIITFDSGDSGLYVDAGEVYGLRLAGETESLTAGGVSARLSFGSPLRGDQAAEAGIHIGLLDSSLQPAPSLAITSAGVTLLGAAGKPLADADGWSLAGVELRGSYDGARDQWSVAGQADTIGMPLGAGFSSAGGSGNTVAKTMVASGDDESDAPVNPGFSVRVGYGSTVGFSFQALDGDFQPTDTVWVPVERRFGPVTCQKVGVRASGTVGEPTVGLVLDGGVRLGALAVTLDELSIAAPLRELGSPEDYALDLQGLAVSYIADGVALSGGLLKNTSDGQVSYDGEALLEAEGYALSAVGSFASLKEDGATSLFVFAWLETPLGGPPFFVVTGLAAGFGYNRALRIPAPNEVASFPLVAGVSNAGALGGDPSHPASRPDPAAALGTLSSWIPPARGEMWFAAGVQFTSFEIVKSDALVVVEVGDEVVVALVGIATLKQPVDGPTWVSAELDLEVVFRPREGALTAAAVLAPGSYVFTGDAHLEGGFGFATWFGENPHAGDFVLTVGGYHPAFSPPSWYPQEPRVGIDWQVSSDIAVVGTAYFAMTPAAMMAGGSLQLTYSAGPLSAWLKADADVVVFWHPFYFEADVSISVGVSFHMHMLFVDVTLSVEIGVDFQIYGPDIGFRAHIDWYVVSFTIGSGPDPGGPAPLDWDDFKALLPAKRQAPANSGQAVQRLAEGQTPTSTPAYLTVSARSGLQRASTVAGTSHWLVRARELVIALEASFPPAPAKPGDPAITGPNATTVSQTADVAVRPVGLPSDRYSAPLTITVTETTDGVTEPTAVDWVLAPITKGIPKAMWGVPVDASAPPTDAGSPTIPAVVGATLRAQQDLPTACTPEMKLATVFADVTLDATPARLPVSPGDQPVGTAPLATGNTFSELACIDRDPAREARRHLFDALLSLGVTGWWDDPLDALAASPGAAFAEQPLEGAPA